MLPWCESVSQRFHKEFGRDKQYTSLRTNFAKNEFKRRWAANLFQNANKEKSRTRTDVLKKAEGSEHDWMTFERLSTEIGHRNAENYAKACGKKQPASDWQKWNEMCQCWLYKWVHDKGSTMSEKAFELRDVSWVQDDDGRRGRSPSPRPPEASQEHGQTSGNQDQHPEAKPRPSAAPMALQDDKAHEEMMKAEASDHDAQLSDAWSDFQKTQPSPEECDTEQGDLPDSRSVAAGDLPDSRSVAADSNAGGKKKRKKKKRVKASQGEEQNVDEGQQGQQPKTKKAKSTEVEDRQAEPKADSLPPPALPSPPSARKPLAGAQQGKAEDKGLDQQGKPESKKQDDQTQGARSKTLPEPSAKPAPKKGAGKPKKECLHGEFFSCIKCLSDSMSHWLSEVVLHSC